MSVVSKTVVFGGTFDPFHKGHAMMLEAGLKNGSFPYEVSRIEIDRDLPSYTYETIMSLKEEHDLKDGIYFLCGSDTLFSIGKWYKYRALLDRIILTVVPRGDDDMNKILARKEHLVNITGAKIVITRFRGPDISSSYIREHIAECADLIPEGTYEYIKAHHLYGM